jgi:hypothetical protein
MITLRCVYLVEVKVSSAGPLDRDAVVEHLAYQKSLRVCNHQVGSEAYFPQQKISIPFNPTPEKKKGTLFYYVEPFST